MTHPAGDDPYLNLIGDIYRLEPPIFAFGGFAEDALLYRAVSRPHSDLDILVLRDDLDSRLRQFAGLGYERFEVFYEIVPGKPLVLNGEHDGLHLEVAIMELDPEGDTYFEVRSQPEDNLCRIYLPEDAFAYPQQTIDETPIRTVSPLAQYQIRAGLDAVNAFGGLRPGDTIAQAKLRAEFFSDRLETDLAPRVES